MESADCAIGYEAANMVYKGAIGFKDDYVEHIMYHRCLSTLKQPVPCVSRCPARVDIPGYIALVREGRYEDAIRPIRKIIHFQQHVDLSASIHVKHYAVEI